MNQLLDLPESTYHADDTGEQPSLSSSIAYQLVTKSPRHAWLLHPRLGGLRRPPTKTFDRGHLIHKLVLGKGAELAVIDAADFKTKAAREARDAAYEARQIPVLADDLADAEAAAAEVLTRLAADDIVLSGDSEVTAKWTETASDGTPVQCRGLLDHLRLPTIYDLKTCRSAHPAAIQRSMPAYGYDMQAAAYRSGIAKIHPELAGRVDFVFLFVELEPAITITPCRPSGTMRELGERRWRRAVDLWARCITTGAWPGYTDGIVNIEAPQWALMNDCDAVAEAEMAAG